MSEATYGYAADGTGGDDQQGQGTLHDIQVIAKRIIDQGQGEMAAWRGPGPMDFPVTRMRYDDENEWASVWRTTGPGVEHERQDCAGQGTAIEHLTKLLTDDG